MKFIEHIKYRINQALWPALLFTILFYFAYHSVQGNYGLLSLRDLNTKLAELKIHANYSSLKKEKLEMLVTGLRKDNFDPELLDERGRDVLGFTKQGEILFFIRDK